ncbi:CHAP domain-containing protein [Rhizobium laguerreae]|uniref:CHAP domain-containing protein n=1 Tax=Rhizobium laguerreae TaxID=1076926 RepID=UPI001C8FDBEE|nr:CHAP domain-containing protein [Rhizobium laguerreae]MBY3378924.1 CHAP domain-containing protein [Rhizobium laguerreae]
MDVKTVRISTKLRVEPSPDGAPVIYEQNPVTLYSVHVLASVEPVAGNQEWSRVTVDAGGGAGPSGFIQSDRIVEKTLNGEQISQADFAALCASACSSFSVDLSYLLALARTETRQFWKNNIIAADVYAGHGACGPFQFMSETWTGLAKEIGGSMGIRLVDILNPSKQAVLAAYNVKDAITRHQMSFNGLPSPAELYLYHFFGWPAAIKVLGGAQTDRIDALLLRVYEQNRVDQILAANGSLLSASGTPRTLAGVIDEVAGRLQQSYQDNVPLLQDAPDWWPLPQAPMQGGGPTPWVDVARREIGQTEKPGKTSTNERIAEYLTAVGFGAGTSDETPWCAAFVAWSLINSGDAVAAATAKALPNRSFASAWKNLPKIVVGPAVGAIGITKSYSRDTTGHVGFITEIKDGGVMLLAGNQRPPGGGTPDCVCEKFFPLVDFLDFRWPA